ncbi:MAG: HAD hydrolase family protein [Faecalibacterium sp.]|jgi:Cof subfamily protein (haloacid dehalogenase superfamily)|nr:HAD hydrolase family protein [Faecalibacterium sp.]
MTQALGGYLVVSDLDHTLLAANGSMPQVNRDMIRLFCAHGGKFTVATGRTAESTRNALGGLALSGPAVCCGGSVVYDFAQNKCLARHALERMPALDAVHGIMAQFPHIGVEIEIENGALRIVRANACTQAHLQGERLGCVFEQPEDVPEPWVKVAFLGAPAEIDALQRYGDTLMQGTKIDLVRDDTACCAIMPAGISKASGLRALAERYGVPMENTIAIGARAEDLACMAAAGHAVAVAGAPGRVQMAADTVTQIGADEGAVAEFLYGFLKKHEKTT